MSRIIIFVFLLLSFQTGTSLAENNSRAAPDPYMPPEARKALNVGLLAASQKDWPLAVNELEKARRQSPLSPQILRNLALAESEMDGRELRAAVWFEAYLALSPTASDAIQVAQEIKRLKGVVQGKAQKLLDTAKSIAVGLSRQNSQSELLYEVAHAEIIFGNIEEAHNLADQIADRDYKLKAIAEIASGYAVMQFQIDPFFVTQYLALAAAQTRLGDLSGAKQSETLAFNATSSLRQQTDLSLKYFLAIAEEQAMRGDQMGVKQSETAAFKIASDDTSTAKFKLYAAIAAEQARRGDLSAARQSAAMIENNIDGATALGNNIGVTAAEEANEAIADEEVREGDFLAARQVFPQLNFYQQCFVSLKIAGEQKDHGDMVGARQTSATWLDQCKEDLGGAERAKKVSGNGVMEDYFNYKDSMIWLAIALANGKLSDPAGIKKSEAEALKLASSLPPAHGLDWAYWDRFDFYLALAEERGERGDLAGADQSLTMAQKISMETSGPRNLDDLARGYALIAEEQAKRGDSGSAEQNEAKAFTAAQEDEERLSKSYSDNPKWDYVAESMAREPDPHRAVAEIRTMLLTRMELSHLQQPIYINFSDTIRASVYRSDPSFGIDRLLINAVELTTTLQEIKDIAADGM